MGHKARNKSERDAGRRAGPPARPDAAPAPSGRAASAAVAVAAVALLLVLVAVWGAPRAAEDMFMGLAGGRDVFDGKLGKPDDWSFTTAGRVWLNQNWGFDAILYTAWRAGGDGGLLALKGMMLLAVAGAAVAAARRRGAGWTPALLVTAAAMAVTREYMELRANLATFVLACLLLAVLYDALRRPRRIWLAVPLVALWSALHGGFTLGLLLLGAWVAAGAVEAFRDGGATGALRQAWAPLAAAAAAAAATVVCSPFGIANLTHPLTVLRHPEWRAVYEWRPASLAAGSASPGAWGFVAMVALVVAATAWRLLTRRGATPDPAGGGSAGVGLVLFDAALLALMAWMGLSALRFLPLAAVVLAPLAAAQVDALFRGPRPWLPAAAFAVALSGAIAPFALRVAATYSAANPNFTDEGLFQRMTGSDKLPSGAAEFLRDNDVGGNAFTEWPWEGLLRWRCPTLRLFAGGRAQQIYDLDTLDRYRRFGNDPQPAARLAEWDVHLLVVPLEGKYLHIADVLAFAPGAQWAAVFYDGHAAVFADVASAANRRLADGIAAGRARYRSPGVAELSRALCAVTGGAAVDMQAIAALDAANRATPTASGPWFMLFAARAHRLPPRPVLLAFEEEYAALTRSAGGRRLATLQARVSVAQILSNLYRSARQSGPSEQWAQVVRSLMPELEALAGPS